MPAALERIVNAILLGLVPPMPNELRADYVQAQADEQLKRRRQYGVKLLCWSWIITGVAIMTMISWMWECGLLAFLGFSAGFAQASDVQKVKDSQSITQTQIVEFKQFYERNTLQDRIRSIDTETFNLQQAVTAAERARRDPDPLHLQRLSELKTEREQLVRRMDKIDATTPAAAHSLE